MSNYQEYRKDVLANPDLYPELFRIETEKNKRRFKDLPVLEGIYKPDVFDNMP